MGEAIRTFDWTQNALGPLERWPVSLRAVVQMMLSQQHAICLFWGPDLNMLYNDAYAPFLGAKEGHALGAPFKDIWSDVWESVRPLAEAALSGQGTFNSDMCLMMNRNGYEEETFWTFSYSPLYGDGGAIEGLINIAVDTTSNVSARRAQDVLQHELMHRVKNSLAVTSAVVTATLRNSTSLDQARETITNRIAALGEAQSMLAKEAEDADIHTVVHEAMRAHLDRPDRLQANGPNVRISSQQALGLSLAIYELATNALKYGALGAETGAVAIDWMADDEGAFSFTWQESGGPVVEPPVRTGFGSRLTNKIVAAYFSGSGATHYEPDGLRFELAGQLQAGAERPRSG